MRTRYAGFLVAQNDRARQPAAEIGAEIAVARRRATAARA